MIFEMNNGVDRIWIQYKKRFFLAMLETRALTPVVRRATKVPIQRFFLEAMLDHSIRMV